MGAHGPATEAGGLEFQRSRAFIAVLLIGVASTIASWLLGYRDSFDTIGGAALTAGLLAGVFLAARSRHITPVAKIVAFGVTLLYVLGKIVDVLFAYRGVAEFTPKVAEFTPWGPVILIVAWIVFDPGRALWGTVTAYYAAVLVPIGVFGAINGIRALAERLDALAPLLLASAAASVLLSVLARLRQEHGRLQAERETMERLALTDFLTGLPNRRRMHAELASETARAERYGSTFGLILFDLDHFKRVNDRHGHLAGDRVLTALARRAQESLRTGDVLGRWGGEEFLIIAPGPGSDLANLAERLRTALSEQPIEDIEAAVTASFGVVAYAAGDTPDTLLGRADTALYRAKERGRNRVEAIWRRRAAPLVSQVNQ